MIKFIPKKKTQIFKKRESNFFNNKRYLLRCKGERKTSEETNKKHLF